MNSTPASKSALALAVVLLLLAGCATTLDVVPPASSSAAATTPHTPHTPHTPPTPSASPEAILSGTADTPQPPAEPQPAEQAPPLAAAPQAAEPAPAEVVTAPEPVDPLRPEVRLNPNDGDAQTDLWDRVRRGFRMPDLETELARDRTQWYASQPDYFMRMTERGSRYLFHIVEEVERRKMPTEMALLPFIESAFNPQAMSSAKASGMWQFMPSTGKHYSLKQNVFRDDRRDVLASTRAALDYLQKLHGMFGDWHLALAAYNWGEGSVSRAIAKNRKAGLPTDYTSLKMPRETQYYVPKLQAIKNLVAKPEAYGLALPAAANHPYFLSVPIERDMDVDLAARLSGMTLDDFKALNPQMNKPVILAAGTSQVLLPYDNANLFVRRLPLHRGPLASWTAWVAPKTVRPAEAAKQVGMSEEQLREVNRIPPRMLVQAGSTLLVPRAHNKLADVSEHLADNAMISLAPDGPVLRKMSLRAGRNDSVASVAKRYRTSAAQVGQWNGVGAGATFKAGQTIVVYVAAKSSGPKAKVSRHASAASKAKPRKTTRASTAKRTVRVAKR